MFASILARLWRADRSRITRFHTSNGRLCLSPLQIIFSLVTTAGRLTFGILPKVPWWTLPTVRFIQKLDWEGKIVFEYSTGASTLWFAEHCKNIFAVEDDPTWAARINHLCSKHDNVRIYECQDAGDYISAIKRPGIPKYDLISIDGSHRHECFEFCLPYLKEGGILVVDNTDRPSNRPIIEGIRQFFAPQDIYVFPGYPLASFHPGETTLCVNVVRKSQ